MVCTVFSSSTLPVFKPKAMFRYLPLGDTQALSKLTGSVATDSPLPTFRSLTMGTWVIETGSVVPSASDRKSTRLNSSHANISYAVFCLKKITKLLSVICHHYHDLSF